MRTPTKLIAFAALVGLAFGAATLAGAAVDPADPEEAAVSPPTMEGGDHAESGHGAPSGAPEHGGGGAAPAAMDPAAGGWP